MGRGSRLALGAIAAAVAAGQVAPSHLGASIALATAAILLVAEARPRFGARALLPVACGAGLIAIRLAIVPAGPSPLATVPDGDGPWRLVVEATGSPRDGQQSATLATAPDAMPAFTVAATLPAYPVVTPGDLVTVDGSIRPRPDSPYGEYLLRIGAVGTLTSRSLAIGPAPDSPGPAPRAAAARCGPRVDARPARAGGGTGRRDPHRPARPGRSRPRRGVHDGRRQPRRRHLGLEHRDRRGGDRRDDRPSRTSPPVGRDDRRDRALRRVRRRVRLGGPRGADGGRRPPRARERASRPRDRRARLGRHASCSSRTRRSSAMPASSSRRSRRPV